MYLRATRSAYRGKGSAPSILESDWPDRRNVYRYRVTSFQEEPRRQTHPSPDMPTRRTLGLTVVHFRDFRAIVAARPITNGISGSWETKTDIPPVKPVANPLLETCKLGRHGPIPIPTSLQSSSRFTPQFFESIFETSTVSPPIGNNA